jgi:hydrogenase maturation protein HypF
MNDSQPIRERRAVQVRGIVQGVGFRPFVYRLALEEALGGFVGNDTDGVTIEVEGPPERLEAFLNRLRSEAPPLARIDSITVHSLPATGATGFHIIASESAGQVTTGIPADAATCPDCLRELLDPQDRRFLYPFLNCTNCGPRFTITRRIPYDRPQTSMAVFPMCPECQREYDDPLNRRFHAQPNACSICGPRVWLEITNLSHLNRPANPPTRDLREAEANPPTRDLREAEANSPTRDLREAEANSPTRDLREAEANSLTRNFREAEANSPPLSNTASAAQQSSIEDAHSLPAIQVDPITQAIQLLLDGQIVAIKGIGGFHLAVDGTNQEAVKRLRQRKQRYGKPLAVMVRDLEAARQLCVLTAEEEALLTTPARPIVLARRHKDSGSTQTMGAPGPDFGTGESIADAVAHGIPWLGLFLPYAPLHHLLFADPRVQALVMTSANLSEEPIAIDNDEARARLGPIADAFLMHNREILQRCDDSVAAIVDGAPQLLRRARGYVPLGVPLPFDAPPLLAVGGHLKNVFTLARGRFAYQSQHMGDLENLTGLDFFRESLDHLMRTFEIAPQAVVHDLHPGYLSTAWAKEWAAQRNLPLVAVQHHHAHIAGCIAEHGLTGPVIGLALDGTGYGTDGKIWGGELLLIRNEAIANPKICHPERSAAESKDLRLLFGADLQRVSDGSVDASPAAFQRFAHLEYVPMPGGEKAIKEPWRMAFAHLRAAGFDVNSEQIMRLLGMQSGDLRVMSRMIERKINVPETSSLGRLFDAVAAVVLGRRTVDYEAQAAIELEGIAEDEPDRREEGDYVPQLWEGERASTAVLRTELIWKAVLKDLWRGVPASRIAARFHAGIAEGFINAAANARIMNGVNQVVMSGGCMHNRRLSRLLRSGLEEEGFEVFQHRQISPGDGGLSYGQIAVAAAMLAPLRNL